jgi:hypothetical protein
MSRTAEYALVLVVVVTMTYLAMSAVVTRTTDLMNYDAELIAR